MINNKKVKGRIKRKVRIRKSVVGTPGCPRLSVYRSLKNISAQIIDDLKGETIAFASTVEKEFKDVKGKASVLGAKRVGAMVAERAKAKGVEKIVFDRNGYRYHGCVRALADAAREKGLRF